MQYKNTDKTLWVNLLDHCFPCGARDLYMAHCVMKKHRLITVTSVAIGVTAICAFSSAPSAQAAGLLIADGGFGGLLEIKEHTAQVTINNGIAVTKVTQVFHNTEKRQLE